LYDPTLKTIFEMRTTQFLEDVLCWGNKVRNITFEEELVSIPKPILIIAFDYTHVIIPIVVQEVNLKP